MSESHPIYLDNNATTSIYPEVLEAMMPFLTDQFYNASSGYRAARPVRKAVEHAREQVAQLLGAEPDEIIFTSGGTEADNTGLGSCLACLPDRRQVVTSVVEHPAVDAFFESRPNLDVTRTPVDSDGCLDLDAFAAVLDPDRTAVASLMWANNETGVVFPVVEAAEIAAEKGVFFHTDAVQAIAKTSVKVGDTGIRFLALSGHKMHAPKGIGVLFVSRNARLIPRSVGGAQEKERRGGTENVPGIVGLGMAAELFEKKLCAGDLDRTRALRDKFEDTLGNRLEGVNVNGHKTNRLPNTSNISFDDTEAAGLLIMLDQAGVCASGGSACHTGSLDPSPVLTAMGIDRARAAASIRFSLSSLTTVDEMDRAADAVIAAVEKFRRLRPKTST